MLFNWGVVTWLLLLRIIVGTDVLYNDVAIPAHTRLWQTVMKMELESDALRKIYPLVTRVEDDEEQDVYERVLDVVKSFDPLKASLLPLYYQLSPGYAGTTTDIKDSYFVLNGKKYLSPEDIFYLKSKDLADQAQVPSSELVRVNEAVIGTNGEAPILIFYGCETDLLFDEFNRILYSEAQEGKIRFVWRCTCQESEPYRFQTYGIDLTLKNDTWNGKKVCQETSLPEEFKSPTNEYTFEFLPEEELSDLDLKVASMLASNYEKTSNFTSTWQFAKSIINNFPLVSKKLSAMEYVDDRVHQELLQLQQKGIDYGMLGLYVNGQHWRMSQLDPWSLVRIVSKELKEQQLLSEMLENYKLTLRGKASLSKELLKKFSQLSLSNLQSSQPPKYDLHRFPGFSESIIYFNDIEKDPQYKEKLSTKLSSFFDKSDFGILPAFKENWNEVVFVIDFSDLYSKENLSALSGLSRALDIIKNGYPQRIGLLPLYHGEMPPVLRNIYELKTSKIEELKNFLEDLLTRKPQLKSSFDDLPPLKDVLQSLKITEPSIIINGEIYPFKANTWNYLIAKVLKKDVTHLKDELKKHDPNSGLSVRGILHLKSQEVRNLKYIPDHFSDATYTTVDNTALKTLGSRIVEYTKDGAYNLLHTVTVVDDFNTKSALKKLINLIDINLMGVRFRVVHRGPLTSNWTKLKESLQSGRPDELSDLMATLGATRSENEIDLHTLKKWLPSLHSRFLLQPSFITANGRFVHLEENEIPTKAELEGLLKREAKRTLDTVFALEAILPGFSEERIDPDFIEMLSSTLTKLFYDGNNLYNNGMEYTTETSLSRLALDDFLEFDTFTSFQSSKEPKPVDVTLVIDPLEERTQKLLSLCSLVKDLPFINVQVLLLPTETLKIMPIRRLYIEGSSRDQLEVQHNTHELFDVSVDLPNHFYINRGSAGYSVDHMLLDVHAFDAQQDISKSNIEGIGGACLALVDCRGNTVSKTITMSTFGYGQLAVTGLGSAFTVQSCDGKYTVESFSLDGRADYIPWDSFDISDFSPKKLYVKLSATNNTKNPHTDKIINVLSIVRDFQDEERYKNMIFSLLDGCNTPVKFWVLDHQLISSEFKQFLKFVEGGSNGSFSFEFIKYQWPPWLRPQRFLDRELAASKVILLDVLFPREVSKVIYLDPASQVSKLARLIDFEFDTPFAMLKAVGNSGEKNYWEEGYWKKFLKDNGLKFFSTDGVFLINLAQYRRTAAGDKLRIHYQRLSGDIFSLANLDQDLVNNLQLEVPISVLKSDLVKPQKDKYRHELVDHWEAIFAKHNEEILDKDEAFYEEDSDYDGIFHDEL